MVSCARGTRHAGKGARVADLLCSPSAHTETKWVYIPSPGSTKWLRVEQVLFGGARLGKDRVVARAG